MKQEQIKIFDTTLRDGQQCPGAGMSIEKNIEYAKLASALGVDVLEAGFPSASKLDFTIVNNIAQELSHNKDAPIIAALCQLKEKQFDCAMEAMLPALKNKKARVHTYLPVDPMLMQASLGDAAHNTKALIQDVYKLIKYTTEQGFEVEFSAEGYSRLEENFDFVTDVLRAAISGGATTINCPDTIGHACIRQGKNYFVENMKLHSRIMLKEFPEKNITWSVHCHNDFGLALENSMNGVFLGPATQIEGCFNGIGERAGNVALEQCILYLKYYGKNPENKKNYSTNIKTESIQAISDFIDTHMLPRQPHWPITGDNACRHTSGGHTNAILKNPLIYQPFNPKDVGSQISLVFGPFSGGNHAKSVIEKHGLHCKEQDKAKVAQYIKNFYEDRRKGITEQELIHAYTHYLKDKEKCAP